MNWIEVKSKSWSTNGILLKPTHQPQPMCNTAIQPVKTSFFAPLRNEMRFRRSSAPFDLINLNQMQTPNDLYSYYPSNLYQPFGSFDEHNQWGSPELSGSFPPTIYPATTFDYPAAAAAAAAPTYPHYHLGFGPSGFASSSPTGNSALDMPWNHPNLSPQSHIQLAPIQSPMAANKKSSIYDQYASNNASMPVDRLAQQMNSINLNNETRFHQYDPNSYGNSSASQPAVPKSYALVVSSDPTPKTNPKPSLNDRSTSFHSDSFLFPSQQQQTSSSIPTARTSAAAAATANPTVNHSTRAMNNNIRRENRSATTNNNNSEFVENLKRQHQYNPKDFSLNPRGARFFVIKSVRPTSRAARRNSFFRF